MIRLAFYGKGGIGKSTTVSNLAAAMAGMGLTVLQVGCDPKADSTINLRNGQRMTTVLALVREKMNDFTLEDMVKPGFAGVLCAEAGGPAPGLGCAGRGIINALEKLEEKGAYETFAPDVVIYDVLGDVVCGGFTMPMRAGYADTVYILTSGESMSIYAAANIAMAVEHFKGRGYAKLGGFIANEKAMALSEQEALEEKEALCRLARDFDSPVVAELPASELVRHAEKHHQTLMEAYPASAMADNYRMLAEKILKDHGYVKKNQ